MWLLGHNTRFYVCVHETVYVRQLRSLDRPVVSKNTWVYKLFQCGQIPSGSCSVVVSVTLPVIEWLPWIWESRVRIPSGTNFSLKIQFLIEIQKLYSKGNQPTHPVSIFVTHSGSKQGFPVIIQSLWASKCACLPHSSYSRKCFFW